MSITDELREYAHDCCARVDDAIHAIADRIDAEHEAALLNVHTDLMDASGWVRLPKDADGEPIHVGDVMEWCDSGDTLEVIGIGDDTLFYIDPEGDRTYAEWTSARNKRHYHAPTVEDVLREFAQKMNENMGMYTGEVIDADEWRQADSKTVEKYAAKLQLKEDA